MIIIKRAASSNNSITLSSKMKIATAVSIVATLVTTSEGKKSKTSNDFYHSKDGDRFAARWGGDDDDWSSHDDDWSKSWSGKSGKSGSKGSKGSGGFDCSSKTFYLDINSNDILEDVSDNGKFDAFYTEYAVYKKSSDVGDNSFDGVLSFTRTSVSDFSCQGQGMLGLGSDPNFKDQIYFSTMCDPRETDATQAEFITATGGGVTGGFGYYAGATGTVTYSTSGDTGMLKFWYCIPSGVQRWGSWDSSESSWDH